MLSKTYSIGFLSSMSKSRNKLNDITKSNDLSTKDLIIRRKKQNKTNTIIKLLNPINSNKYRKTITNFYINKENTLHKATIYLKLEKSEEIAKIVNEEEKKRFFNREFHLNKNVNRDELKRRIKIIHYPYKRTYNISTKSKEKARSICVRRKKRLFSSSYNSDGIKSIKSLINTNNKLFHNYKYQGENEILKSKMNYDAVTNFLQSMDEQKKLLYEEMEKKFIENKKKNPYINENETNKKYKNQKINEENKIKKINKLIEKEMKLKEADFIKFKKRMIIKEKKNFRQKSKVFDNILRYDFKN